ncbi:hypothetical protein Dsin_028675 [Dipteronia sinensis]|uniref:Uncharacterized protein n=1 Tax=Dipteronia sinensis TaxID=43782 RepID=A0AAE0DUU3_9ROSI|nr:hypothetical protein Dsin_028675 [Dipteronia sinensis]
MLFSKKPFPVFLESSGYNLDDVLFHKPKAALLKPAFTIIRDRNSKCLLLLIRGTHSIKDTLTAATGAVVPFHHSVLHDGGISNLVLGKSSRLALVSHLHQDIFVLGTCITVLFVLQFSGNAHERIFLFVLDA